jgi:hypothetical protein
MKHSLPSLVLAAAMLIAAPLAHATLIHFHVSSGWDSPPLHSYRGAANASDCHCSPTDPASAGFFVCGTAARSWSLNHAWIICAQSAPMRKDFSVVRSDS